MSGTDRDETAGEGTERDDLLEWQNKAPVAKEEKDDGEGQAASRLPVYTTSPKGLWIPIIACIVVSGLLAAFLNSIGIQQQYGLSESDYGIWAVLVNAVVFIAIGAGSAFVLIIIVRRRGINALEKIMMFAFLILGTVIIWLYGDYFLVYLSQYVSIDNSWSYACLVAAFIISLFLVYVYVSPKYRDSIRVHNLVVVIFGVLIGSYLAVVIPTWTSLVILMGFALYDIYSVRKGPIKEMMKKLDPGMESDTLTAADLDDISIDIGIGDLAFYSMLTSITLISSDWGGPALVAATGNMGLYIIPFIAAVVGVLIGAWISFELVKKNKILPGLPMSIFIGIGLYSLAIVICLAI